VPSDIDNKYKLAEQVSNYLSEGDVIENYIYGEQIWDLNEVHGFYSCAGPSYFLCHDFVHTNIKLNFPADLNKASIGKINKKNILNAGKKFKNKNIQDYIYINLILRNLLEENKINEFMQLISDYDVDINSIESLLKVDKIKSSKMNLTSKQRKEMTTFMDKS
jgi:hypothetical protein